uniref:Uncharacterized protein n=1 Tax=Panagrellus redivivus TaxID=6233 RepID=A0A7E4V235_PANRE
MPRGPSLRQLPGVELRQYWSCPKVKHALSPYCACATAICQVTASKALYGENRDATSRKVTRLPTTLELNVEINKSTDINGDEFREDQKNMTNTPRQESPEGTETIHEMIGRVPVHLSHKKLFECAGVKLFLPQ